MDKGIGNKIMNKEKRDQLKLSLTEVLLILIFIKLLTTIFGR